jgi:LysM repeat protein
MREMRFWLSAVLTILSFNFFGQGDHPDKLEYIKKYKDLAIQEMYKYKIPASITLAQGILESGSGKSALAKEANNHFGIKCHREWNGPTFHQDDDAINECFRKYNDPVKSFEDHSIFLATRSRYSKLFQLDITDYKGWARGLKKAGYATDPSYPKRLIKIIKDYNLSQYDKLSNKTTYQKPRHSTTRRSIKKRKRRHSSGKNDFEDISLSNNNLHEVRKNNGVKFVYARSGDTYASIAKEFNIYPFQLAKYNDADKSNTLREDEIVYLQRKKNKAKKKFHKADGKESLYDISQKYGVKLSRLVKYNEVKEKTILPKGKRVYLKKKPKKHK